ncbi:MAG TPA: hypothetical protein VMU58_08445 [Gaiellaceae bacterium]|nr:hypothetical protein [Gaiellaceae bacterium]
MGPAVWYHVRELDGSRHFCRDTLGFDETAVDERCDPDGNRVELAQEL